MPRSFRVSRRLRFCDKLGFAVLLENRISHQFTAAALWHLYG
jgi:hypothetical protein